MGSRYKSEILSVYSVYDNILYMIAQLSRRPRDYLFRGVKDTRHEYDYCPDQI